MPVHLSVFDESMALPGGGVHRVHRYEAVQCGEASEPMPARAMGWRVHCVNPYDQPVLLEWGGNAPLCLAPRSSIQIVVDAGHSVAVAGVEPCPF